MAACKLVPGCNAGLMCMEKCSDSACESQCLSDAASKASPVGAAAIFALSTDGGAHGCFNAQQIPAATTGK
eukprot:CAMPEP_0177249510 /NCGR_PEP_ID=MMETSP0367-20130122/52807_1 /TAXON_ID=447022 ORGANISM="Scrippsiella hangoei-like, Strain SHHI-4" /NCGR_SAMPLE_ID=MMETSP0367 /ASSEMBLY_ACC=CAM_ASM_000362 /LENGTH=70 /DNA_ID=CAMNT_0018702053 /DNA_START=15 /DNA_END=224 /DNA_ORIENTATION=-